MKKHFTRTGGAFTKRELLKNGCIRIFISDQELQECGLSFHTLDAQTEQTQALLAALLWDAKSTLHADLSRLTVEVLPVGGGALFLLTPLGASSRRLKPRCYRYPLIYAIADAEALLSFAEGWKRLYPTIQDQDTALGASSLYRFETEYRLLLYPLSPLDDTAQGLLNEWGKRIGTGDAVAAFTAEHGSALCIGNALPRLCGALQ